MEKYQKIGVSGFLLRDGRVLVVKRSDADTFLPGNYELPGGKVEFGESPEQAVEREYKEETGLDVEVVRPVCTFSYVSDDGSKHTVDITYVLSLRGSNADVVLSDEHSDYRWVSQEEIAAYPISENMLRCILAGIELSEFK